MLCTDTEECKKKKDLIDIVYYQRSCIYLETKDDHVLWILGWTARIVHYGNPLPFFDVVLHRVVHHFNTHRIFINQFCQ